MLTVLQSTVHRGGPSMQLLHTSTAGGVQPMDPISLILGALAAGVGPGLTDVASAAIKDAYEGLHTLLRRLFTGRAVAETALEQHSNDPEAWRPILMKELQAAGAANDRTIVE